MENWDETRLEKELALLMDEVSEAVDVEKKIEEAIQRKIKRVVFRTVVILGTGLFVLVLLINPFLNAIFLNPHKLHKASYEMEAVEKDETKQAVSTDDIREEQDVNNEGDAECSVFLGVLRDYWETMQPFTEIIDIEVEKKGFSRYKLGITVSNRRGALDVGIKNVLCDVAFGEYKNWMDPEHRLVHHYTYSHMADEKEDYIERMEKLPDSAMIYLTLGESNPMELEELRGDLEKKDIYLDWIQVYQPNVDFQGGLSMNMQAAWKETDLRYNLTSDELKQVYVSNLDSLMKHIEIWKPFGLHCNNKQYYQEELRLKETYEDAKKLETLTCKKYSIYGEKADILSYFKEKELEYFDVYGVEFTSWGY